MAIEKVILEVAILDVRPGQETEFELAFARASAIVSSMDGYLGHDLKRCIETPSRYVLLVNWRRIEDHTEGFRKSSKYEEWKALLHQFYDPFPVVEHYQDIAT